MIKLFDLKWHLGVMSQGQTMKPLKPSVSKTVRDRKMVSIKIMYMGFEIQEMSDLK